MSLAQFLAEKRMNPESFAKLVGLHPTTIYRLLRYQSFPKRQNLVRILAVTEGKVTITELWRRT